MRAESDGSEDELAINPVPAKMEKEAFNGILGEIVGRIEPETEASPEAILGQFVVTFGNLIGRRPHWRINATTHRANIFLCICGPTGSGRKGTAWDVTRWLLSMADPDWGSRPILSGLTSGEGLIQICKDSRHPVLAVETEFARLLANAGRDNNTLTAVLRQAFDGPVLWVPTRKDSLYVDDAHVSIIGHITYSELKNKLSQVYIDNGLVNRFLWMHTYRSRELPEGGDFWALKQVLAPFTESLMLSADFAKNDGGLDVPFRRDKAAKEFWAAIYHSLTESLPGNYGMAVERRAPIIMRLAMIYACLDRDFEVRVTHLESAMAFFRYCDQTSRHIFVAPVVDRKLTKLMELLDSAEHGLTKTELNRKLAGGRVSASDLDSLIQSAYSTGKYLYKEEATGGRKRHVLINRKYGVDQKSDVKSALGLQTNGASDVMSKT